MRFFRCVCVLHVFVQVVGADRTSTSRPATIEYFLHHFVMELRKQYPSSLFVNIVESNLSFVDAERVANTIHNPPCYTIRKDPKKKNRVGVFLDELMKKTYADDLKFALAQGTLRRSRWLVPTLEQWASTQDDTTLIHSQINIDDIKPRSETAMSMLDTQMGDYQKITKYPKDMRWQSIKVSYSGKTGGKKDDLIIGLQMAVTWRRIMMVDDEFRSKLQQIGVIQF